MHGLAESLKRVELSSQLNTGDVSDWIATFDDRMDAAEKLSILIDGATTNR